MNRKDFIYQTAVGLAALSVGVSCTKQKGKSIPQFGPQSAEAKMGDIRALLLHLGSNMWCDYPTEMMGAPAPESAKTLDVKPEFSLVWPDEMWRKVTDRAAAAGVNMIVIDLGEGVFYPSHPELAVEGTWSVEKMQTEIKRLNSLGIEVVPKLNFSTTHNGWMGDYSHMVSSKPYYRMCEEVISDVVEIFGHPRFFHIGFDEERSSFQEGQDFQYICTRKGEYWWQDFLHIVREVEKHGSRPWMWCDFGWNSDEFYERCPKSVIQQNWFYDECHGGFDPETNTTSDAKILKAFKKLDDAGFDQVPCGTNWIGWGRRELGLDADDVIGKLVKFGRENISKEHLLGFMMGTWEIYAWPNMTREEHFQKIFEGIDLFEEAMK
ncbi:MAG: family 20 glycosylhydrolase [Alistipes sp.]|nr:family 20 glycosylhydrolase [Alistipes sp.]